MIKSGSLVLCFLCLIPKTISSQNAAPPAQIDSIKAIMLINKANELYDSNQFEAAFEQGYQAYQYCKKNFSNSSPVLAEAAYQSGRSIYRLRKLNQAKELLTEAISIWEKSTSNYQLKTAKAQYWLAYTENRLGNTLGAIPILINCIAIQNANFSNSTDLIKSYMLIGDLYTYSKSHKQATPYLEQAYELTKPEYLIDSKLCAFASKKLAENYFKSGKYIQSIALSEQAISYLNRSNDLKDKTISECLIQIGEAQQHLNNPKLALFYYQKALEFSLTLTKFDSIIVSYCYTRISGAYYTTKDYINCISAGQKSVDFLRNYEQTNLFRYPCIELGKAYLANKDYSLSNTWFKKSIDIIGTPKNSNDSSDLALTLVYVAKMQYSKNDFIQSEISLKSAKNILANLYGNEYTYLSIVDEVFGKLYSSLYLKHHESNYLLKSINYLDSASHRIQNVLMNTSYDEIEILKILKDASDIFESTISTHINNNSSSNFDSIQLEYIWGLNEFMHNYPIFRQMKRNNAMASLGILDSLITLDSLNQVEIKLLEKQRQFLLTIEKLSLIDTNVLKLNINIFEKKVKKQNLLATIDKTYLSSQDAAKIPSLSQLKLQLNANQTIIEYFCGESTLYIFIIQNANVKVKEIKLDFPLINLINNMNDGITKYHTSNIRSEKMYKEKLTMYMESATKLYKLLIQPFEEILTTELIIIPDALLSNLSFDALLTSIPNDPTNFKTFPFLVHKFSIQYSFSAGMFLEMSKPNPILEHKGEFIGFAPFYDKQKLNPSEKPQNEIAIRFELSNLPYSGEEINLAKIRFINNSVAFLGKDATKQQFELLANQYKIIHLATHGKANFQNGEFSFIAFRSHENPETYDLLSVADLYNLKLKADLVILSACQTANGELYLGVGIVSLASAFASAGAKSIVGTFWNVNDKSTMQLVDQFYTELKSGKQKNIALTQAKRNYLAKNPGQASHPFFWAGFVSIGNMDPIQN